MNKLFTASMKALSTLTAVVFCMVVLITIVGCGEQTYQEPVAHWYKAGPLEYRFPNAYTCVIQVDGQKYNIPRHMEEGEIGELEWEWEDDGDIDVEYFNASYDLDSPFDYDSGEEFEGYEDIGEGFIMVWLGGKLVKKKKSTFLAANPRYNKQYTRTKYAVNKDGSVTKTKVTTVKGTTGAKTEVKKTTVASNGTKTVSTKTTYVPKKKTTYKKKSSSKKRRK